MNFEYSDTTREIRSAVASLCSKFGPDYWQKCEATERYPEEFVAAMSQAGWL
ncbi:MAG: acyl-CoA dehydrogenase, partial [Betaproteobacteria bacterium]|nr:acyl-CoA dehydrogenase [Betaproteobacteria bacterium]